MTRFSALFCLCLVMLSGSIAGLAAQQPAINLPQADPGRPSVLPPGDRLQIMQTVATALGVRCVYCHGERGAELPQTSAGRPRMDVARQMFVMTSGLNMTVQDATGKAAADVARVNCVTCHRGVAIPRQLGEIMLQTSLQQGPDAAVAQYRELRKEYYGRQAYDFSEESLIVVADRLANARPAVAVALMKVNIEFYPQSSRSYASMAFAQTRLSDNEGAIASLRKALEIDPNNGPARGRLAQLEEQYNRPR